MNGEAFLLFPPLLLLLLSNYLAACRFPSFVFFTSQAGRQLIGGQWKSHFLLSAATEHREPRGSRASWQGLFSAGDCRMSGPWPWVCSPPSRLITLEPRIYRAVHFYVRCKMSPPGLRSQHLLCPALRNNGFEKRKKKQAGRKATGKLETCMFLKEAPPHCGKIFFLSLCASSPALIKRWWGQVQQSFSPRCDVAAIAWQHASHRVIISAPERQ